MPVHNLNEYDINQDLTTFRSRLDCNSWVVVDLLVKNIKKTCQIPSCDRAYVMLSYANRTLTPLCDENKLCVSCLQPKFTKVSTGCVTDSRTRKQ